MGFKRKHVGTASREASHNKRYRPTISGSDEESSKASQSKVDPTYGQRGAFPDLDDDDGEKLFYGPASDGLEYLRMVRSEAKTVPTLLVAPTSQANGHGDFHSDIPGHEEGFYADGAYTAAPASPTYCPSSSMSLKSDTDPQDAYYSALSKRFAAHSSIFQHPPQSLIPSSINAELAKTLNSTTRHRWRSVLNTTPTSSLLALLTQDAVLQGLSVLETRITEENLKKKTLGSWAWGLLGRCRPVGEMSSEEVGVLRDLGKKAILVLRGVKAGLLNMDGDDDFSDESEEGEMESLKSNGHGDSVETGATGEKDTTAGAREEGASQYEVEHEYQLNPPNSLEEAKSRMLASLPAKSVISDLRTTGEAPSHTSPSLKLNDPQSASSHSPSSPPSDSSDDSIVKRRVTLDMIITIVGEFYGQRDLLEGRLSWDDPASE